jgi:hypothetical protein
MPLTLEKELRTPVQMSPAAAHASPDRGYWLVHREGYQVESVHGRVGFVDDALV